MGFCLSRCWRSMRKHLSTAQRNGSASVHQIANIFLISLAQSGKIARKRQYIINLFVIYTFPNMIVRKIFIQMCFSKNGMTLRNSKKKLRKESWKITSGTTKWDKLGQVGVVGQVGQGQGGLQILVGQVEQGEGGLQIFVGQVGQGQGVCPLEPFHLSQMGLQDREFF